MGVVCKVHSGSEATLALPALTADLPNLTRLACSVPAEIVHGMKPMPPSC